MTGRRIQEVGYKTQDIQEVRYKTNKVSYTQASPHTHHRMKIGHKWQVGWWRGGRVCQQRTGVCKEGTRQVSKAQVWRNATPPRVSSNTTRMRRHCSSNTTRTRRHCRITTRPPRHWRNTATRMQQQGIQQHGMQQQGTILHLARSLLKLASPPHLHFIPRCTTRMSSRIGWPTSTAVELFVSTALPNPLHHTCTLVWHHTRTLLEARGLLTKRNHSIHQFPISRKVTQWARAARPLGAGLKVQRRCGWRRMAARGVSPPSTPLTLTSTGRMGCVGQTRPGQ
mmetsp:Transcript_68158/g.99722  ORF Transcript_68158/g.99722 Transcript_68158/m.99722 type:complete len:282 (-) Transcript_68158:647-1492(-)